MGIIGDLLTGPAPKLEIVPLDPGTQQLMHGQLDRMNQSNAQMNEQYNSGINQGANMLQTADGLQRQAAGSGQNASMLEAIRNQYNGVAGKDIQRITRQNDMNQTIHRAKQAQQVTSSYMAQKQIETTNFENLMSSMNEAEKLRAQTLASVLGAAGAGAGMYFGMKGQGGSKPTSSGGYSADSGFDPATMEAESFQRAQWSGRKE